MEKDITNFFTVDKIKDKGILGLDRKRKFRNYLNDMNRTRLICQNGIKYKLIGENQK